jgi:hypothetical protein
MYFFAQTVAIRRLHVRFVPALEAITSARRGEA